MKTPTQAHMHGLEFDSTFSGGNGAVWSCREDAEGLELEFVASPHGGLEALWFCFRLCQTVPRRIRLVWSGMNNILGNPDASFYRPVMRVNGGEWQRLNPGQLRTGQDGRQSGVWDLTAFSGTAELALSFPYGLPELEDTVETCGSFWTAEAIGLTQGGRNLVRVSNIPGTPGADLPGVYIIARQHAGETPGSWVLDGMLREWARSAPHWLIWAVPLANMDGVDEGDYGKDPWPWDMNRAWGWPAMRYETRVLQADINRWRERCQPALILDLHAPGGAEQDGVYAYGPPDSEGEELRTESGAARNIAHGFHKALGEWASERFLRVPRHHSRWQEPCRTLTGYAREVLQLPSLSLETPYCSIGASVLEKADYRAIGASLAKSLIDPDLTDVL